MDSRTEVLAEIIRDFATTYIDNKSENSPYWLAIRYNANQIIAVIDQFRKDHPELYDKPYTPKRSE